jgi:hypothetical protein
MNARPDRIAGGICVIEPPKPDVIFVSLTEAENAGLITKQRLDFPSPRPDTICAAA